MISNEKIYLIFLGGYKKLTFNLYLLKLSFLQPLQDISKQNRYPEPFWREMINPFLVESLNRKKPVLDYLYVKL